MAIKLQNEISIEFGNRKYIRVPDKPGIIHTWREHNNAFSLRRDAGVWERDFIALLDEVYEDKKSASS